jgi:hypothetical protein
MQVLNGVNASRKCSMHDRAGPCRCNPYGFLDPSDPERQLLTDSGIQARPNLKAAGSDHSFLIQPSRDLHP